MSGARIAVAAVLTVLAVSLIAVQGVSWRSSARFGALAATSLPCAVRLDAVGPVDASAGLRPGDTILLKEMDAPARTAGVFHYTPTQVGRAGETVHLAVQRAGLRFDVAYRLTHTDGWPTFAAQLGFKVLLAGIGLFVLWRGANAASLVLAVWCVLVAVGLPDAWYGALPLPARIAGGALTALCWTSAPFVLYLIVESVASGVSLRARLVARGAMIALLVPALIVNTVDALSQAVSGCWAVAIAPWLANAAFVASQLVIVAFFIFSYVRTSGIAKQRVRWVFWAFMFSRAGVLLNLANRLSAHPLHLSGFEWATVAIFPLGCTYAILRHRIIDVNFVLNRTLVYTVMTTIVVGAFILIEDVLAKVAAGRGVGIAVDVIFALALGFSFNALHKYVESTIERALFRGKHEASANLRLLAEEAAFTENAHTLLQRAVRDIATYTGAPGVAIYERGEGAYFLSATFGNEGLPETVNVDDLAFVRLRRSRGCLDLGVVESALHGPAVAFAFVVRGQLLGVLLCGKRVNGEAYAPDEIALLGSVAHEIGAELAAIRARQQAELLDKLLAGSLDLREARATRMVRPTG